MPIRQQNPLRRFADHLPQLVGGITLSADLRDDQRGTVTLEHGDAHVELRAVGLSLPYPSGLRRLRAAEPGVELVVVERAPRGLQRLADEENINYLDLDGRGRVVAPGFVYVADPRPYPAAALTPSGASPFAPYASRVVRVLLSEPAVPWRLSDICRATNLNPGNVHRALTTLLDQGAVERDDDNYLVTDPGALLEAWADHARPPKQRRRIPIDHPNTLRDAVRRILDSLGPDAAVVSGELAAEELAPYLPAESAIIHVFDPQVFATVGGEPNRYNFATGAVRPGQIEVGLADTGYGQFATIKDDLPLASPQQVYVDLARDQGRGHRAAEHVRSALLEF